MLILLLLPIAVDAEDLTESQKCFYTCTAECLSLEKNSTVQNCLQNCENLGFCFQSKTEEKCRNKCNALNTPPLAAVNELRWEEQNLTTAIVFPPVREATIYVVQYRVSQEVQFSPERLATVDAAGSYFVDNMTKISTKPVITDFLRPESTFCKPVDIRCSCSVAAVSPSAIGPFSEPRFIGQPQPLISARLELLEVVYKGSSSSWFGTIELTFKYLAGAWPLGLEDLEVTPMMDGDFCEKAAVNQSVPLPNYAQGSFGTIVARLDADAMYRRCHYLYYAEEVKSKQCLTRSFPATKDSEPVILSCNTVKNSRCTEDAATSPVCGPIKKIHYEVTEKVPMPGEPNKRLLWLNVTFDPVMEEKELPTLYYKAFYGQGEPYDNNIDVVNLTRNIKATTNCLKFDNGNCLESHNSILISGIRYDTTYGIIFCAIKNITNRAFPDFLGNNTSKPKGNRIYVSSAFEPPGSSTKAVIIGITGAALSSIVGIIFMRCYIKRQKRDNKIYRLKLSQRENASRYNLPRQSDIWEIERRNLIIYDEAKLGSGAFGAVYLGRLLGKSPANRDSKSTLGVNLMRAENCQVAVKMLPESADDASRGEFLREIGLMKKIGYHERLVNMLACITESEPLCLVAEFCSDGDLLNFLRERCKYMIKLNAQGINYDDPEGDNYNIDMIVTLKQLLMFAVQISYGLEYLSTRGFIHRDIAARNILVNGKNSCKIGDFGLCRNLYSDSSLYRSKGGRLPLKWMSPEAIRHYEFSTQSDVWAFGVLLFEIITLGGSPYPLIPPEDLLNYLEKGRRMERPDNCPEQFYEVMAECWRFEPEKRPDFSTIRQKLAAQLEEITEEYNYLKLDSKKDYYNVQYAEKPDIIVIPESEETISPPKPREGSQSLSFDSMHGDDVRWIAHVNSETDDATRKRNSRTVSIAKNVDDNSFAEYAF
ncbi:unnamed protein product [Cylicocyclus nassatus]|uniref:Protein kinase domain-containing protein n=1 Tax=Cylicocyclus nassatus TaxID=53992 RepID=A0AA36M9Y5_CYLNA|nr:unnamed protein product [Cylicocyclus nassatus]